MFQLRFKIFLFSGRHHHHHLTGSAVIAVFLSPFTPSLEEEKGESEEGKTKKVRPVCGPVSPHLPTICESVSSGFQLPPKRNILVSLNSL